jgi:DMSO/TMAO reductase YedYZ heme-binding membrane subunit
LGYEWWDKFLPEWFTDWVVIPILHGTLSTAFFVIVMYIGALSDKVPGVKGLREIRGALSIIACILAVGHNVSFGTYYFPAIFSGEPEPVYIISACMSVALIAIMLPLGITSVRAVRRKMRAGSWKKLQRWAYVFYALLYVDTVMLFAYALATVGSYGLSPDELREQNFYYISSLIVYSAVFLSYFVLRICKAFHDRKVDN